MGVVMDPLDQRIDLWEQIMRNQKFGLKKKLFPFIGCIDFCQERR